MTTKTAAQIEAEAAAQTHRMILNATLARSQLLSKLIDPRRDIDDECGYPKAITVAQYRLLYDREGLAARVVAVFPEESWALDPEVYETEEGNETAFEKEWKALQEKLNIYAMLLRADRLSGIGRFGIVLMGFDDGKSLDQPLDGVEGVEGVEGKTGAVTRKLLFLRAFDESVVTISERETNIANPRYGQPTLYSVTLETTTIVSGSDVATQSQKVHWTRAIHLADNRETSELYGVPRMQVLFNRLYDIRKLAGGSGEMFWKGAFPGIVFEVNPDLGVGLTDADKESMREEFTAYQDGLQRYLALEGVTAKSLAVQVADPRGHVDVQLELIAIALGVPQRILFGSEQAQLASGQDSKTWNKRLNRRREKYITPLILRPFVDRCITAGVLPVPATPYMIDWPDLNAPSDQERADVVAKQVEAMSKYINGGVDQLVPPREFLMIFMGMSQEEVDAIIKKAVERIGDDVNDPIEAERARNKEEADAAAAQAAKNTPGGKPPFGGK